MYFHMEQGDLNDIMNKRKPDNLPDHLGSNLQSNLRDWIKNTYSPAFTALTIANSFNTRGWESKFTDRDRKKILYFWQGSVSLACTKHGTYRTLRVD